MEPLCPSAYAPYRDPRDYILSWTDTIWIDRAIGRLGEHYSEDIKVHTAYGETYDYNSVIANSVQKFSAFPNGGGGHGEDVVWEQRGVNGFISFHRVLKTGTHSGFWTYGPPTGRDFISRTVAHCLVQDNRIVEEWLVRDEFAVLEALGLDPYKVAAELAARSPVLGSAVTAAPQGGAFAGHIEDPVAVGISGPRPPRHQALCEMIRDYFKDVWNRRRFDLASRYVSDRIVCHVVRMRRVQNLTPYQMEIINLLASFPDGQVEIRDIAVCDGPELGLRVGVIWVLRGTYSGVPTYGPPTNTPIHLLGASQFDIHEGRILREWRIYDEVAVLAQIMAARG
ncbi:MAG: ester cyclase [Rhodospirillales bacterium]|nr:ester cyclase [Rhodospirillales bacterium]MDE2200923.1 ester cyclase [Rhodospirillales bacterium]MDE2576811.1 ester cyclase [Rhodospirillales bacterium]